MYIGYYNKYNFRQLHKIRIHLSAKNLVSAELKDIYVKRYISTLGDVATIFTICFEVTYMISSLGDYPLIHKNSKVLLSNYKFRL